MTPTTICSLDLRDWLKISLQIKITRLPSSKILSEELLLTTKFCQVYFMPSELTGQINLSQTRQRFYLLIRWSTLQVLKISPCTMASSTPSTTTLATERPLMKVPLTPVQYTMDTPEPQDNRDQSVTGRETPVPQSALGRDQDKANQEACATELLNLPNH